jgi:Concanavalin A-like lectin/glucanases superfamily
MPKAKPPIRSSTAKGLVMLKQSPTISLGLRSGPLHLFALLLCLCLFLLVLPNGVFTQATETCIQPPSGIIAWWPLDETSGTNAQDIVGSSPGVHVNGPVPAIGNVQGALRFDGVNDYVSAPGSNLWAFGSNDFTIEFWANFDAPGSGTVSHPGDIFIGNDEGPFIVNKWFFALGGGRLEFVFSGPAIGDQFLTFDPFAPNTNQWYHLAVRRQGNTFTAFVNGLPAGSVINTAAIPNPNAPLTIGQAESLGFMNGRLDEVAIYNRALSASEVQAISTPAAPESVSPASFRVGR